MDSRYFLLKKARGGTSLDSDLTYGMLVTDLGLEPYPMSFLKTWQLRLADFTATLPTDMGVFPL